MKRSEDRQKNTRFSRIRKGSLTVEAALSVPLFFLCVVSMICLMDLYRQIAVRTTDLMQQAEKAGVLAGMTGDNDIPVIDVKRPIVYTIRWLPVPGLSITAACRGRVRPWTGRDLSDDTSADSAGKGKRMVYVTEYGTVYHTDPSCSHLHMDISCMTAGEAAFHRNNSGQKYYACEKCARYAEAGGKVYLTEYGDKYHCSPDCSGLTRSVRLVAEDEADGMRECADCAARHDG